MTWLLHRLFRKRRLAKLRVIIATRMAEDLLLEPHANFRVGHILHVLRDADEDELFAMVIEQIERTP